MLDKRRNRRMNSILKGLGDNGDSFEPFAYGDAPIVDQPVLPDIPVDDGTTGTEYSAATPDIPTVFDQPVQTPQPSTNLDLVNKVLTVGAQTYKYVRSRDAQGRTVAIPRPVQKSSVAVPLAILVALWLLNS